MDDRTYRDRADMIAELVAGMTYTEWSRIQHCIEQKYSSASCKVIVHDAKEFKGMFDVEF